MGSFVDVTDYGHGGWKVIIVAVLLIIIQILMVTGRFVSRKANKIALAADDYVLLFATVLTTGLCALALACKCLSRAVPRKTDMGCQFRGSRASDPAMPGFR